MKEVKIKTQYITLGQFLKFVNVISCGGEEKNFCKTHKIVVNNEDENRRGRKLYPADEITVEKETYKICS